MLPNPLELRIFYCQHKIAQFQAEFQRILKQERQLQGFADDLIDLLVHEGSAVVYVRQGFDNENRYRLKGSEHRVCIGKQEWDRLLQVMLTSEPPYRVQPINEHFHIAI